MNDVSLEEIRRLIRDHGPRQYRKVLLCAPDVWENLKETLPAAMPFASLAADLSLLSGIEVQPVPDYDPGRWRLIQHDHCQVTGGGAIDQAMLITHKECTVLAES